MVEPFSDQLIRSLSNASKETESSVLREKIKKLFSEKGGSWKALVDGKIAHFVLLRSVINRILLRL